MQKIFNPNSWALLEEGSSRAFSDKKKRPVTLQVNAPVKTALWYVPVDQHDEDGVPIENPVFLALVEGRDTIEFVTQGAFELTVEGAPVFVLTSDGDDTSAVVVEPVVFTKIMERRRRDLESEYMAAIANLNMEKRLAEIHADLERKYAHAFAPPGNSGESASPAVASPSPAAAGGAAEAGAETADASP